MTTQTVTLRLVADGGQLVGTLKTTEGALGKVGNQSDKTKGKLGGLNQQSEQLAATQKRVADQAKALFAAFVSIQGARQLIGIADSYANISSRLDLATESQNEYNRAQSEVLAISQRTSTALETSTNLYARLARSTRDYNISQERVLQLTESINQTFAISGADTVRQSNAVIQLTQAFAGGVLRAEEFNSVIENSPRLAEALADGLGLTAGELRAAVNEGAVSVDRIIGALESQSAAIQTEFEQMPLTIERAFTRVQNAVLSYIGTADQGRGASAKLAEGIALVADNIDTVANVILVSASAVAAVLVGRLAAAFTTASIAAVRGTAENLRYQATLASMAGLSATAAARITALGAAKAAASRAFALFGGPVGAVISGLSLLLPWLLRNKEAIDSLGDTQTAQRGLKELTSELNAINNSAQLLTQEQKAAIDATHAEIRSVAESIATISQLRDSAAASGNLDAVRAYQAEIDKMQNRVGALSNQLRDFDAALKATSATTTTVTAEVTNSGNAATSASKQFDFYAGFIKQAAGASTELADATNQEFKATSESARARLAEITQLQRVVDLIETGTSVTEALTQAKREQLAGDKLVINSLEEQIEKAREAEKVFESFMDLDIGADFSAGFDDMSASLGTFLRSFNDLIEAQEQYAQAVNAAGNDQTKLDALAIKNLKLQISTYGDLSGAAKDFFEEGSKGYKTLQTAEKVFRAFELAMLAKSVAAKLAADQTKIVSSAAVAAAEGVAAAVSSMVGLPFPLNLAALAVTVAAIVGLGVKIGGGGSGGGGGGGPQGSFGGQDLAGSTVLGSNDPSESLSKSLERLIDIARPELELTSQMARSLQNIDNALSGVASGLERTFGSVDTQIEDLRIRGTIGDVSTQFVSGTKSDLINELLSPEDLTDTAFGREISNLFSSLGDALAQGTAALGGDVAAALDIVMKEGVDIYLTSNNPAELFEQYFNTLGDLAFTALADATGGQDLTRFQLINEGFAETVFRVISGLDEATLFAERFGISLASLDDVSSGVEDVGAELLRLSLVASETVGGFTIQAGALAVEVPAVTSGLGQLIQNFVGTADEIAELARTLFDARESLQLFGFAATDVDADMLSAAGGLDSFTEGLESFIDNFTTEEERFSATTTRLATDLQQLGVESIPSTREAFAELVRSGLIPLDESLIELADGFYSASEAAIATSEAMLDAAYRFDVALGFATGFETLADQLDLLGLSMADLRVAAAIGIESVQAFFVGLSDPDRASLAPFTSQILSLIPDRRPTIAPRPAFTSTTRNPIDTSAQDAESAFARNFLTDAERLTQTTEALSDALERFGVDVIPDAREAFSELVREGVIPMDAALFDLAGSFYAGSEAAADAAQLAADAAAQAAAEVAQAAYDFDVALGFATGLEPLTAALQILGLSIEGLQDAAAIGIEGVRAFFGGLSEAGRAALSGFTGDILGLIPEIAVEVSSSLNTASRSTPVRSAVPASDNSADERLRLEGQILTLLDASVEIRRRERKELSASNRALFDQLNVLQEHQAALQDSTRTYDSILSALSSYRDSLRQTTIATTGGSLEDARRRLADTERRARLGDINALQSLPDIGRQLEKASGNLATSQLEYLRDLAAIDRALSGAEGVATRQKNIAEQQFNEIAEQTLILLGIKDSLESLQDNTITVPGFASGGSFGGGLRVVGENGPELELTGPSRIFNAADTANMIGGGAQLVAEFRALRQEVRQLRDENQRAQVQLVLHNSTTSKYVERAAKRLDQWEEEGFPPTEAAA